MAECLLLALSGHSNRAPECPLSGRADIVKYTPHRRSLCRRGETRPFFHLHTGDELVATVLGPED